MEGPIRLSDLRGRVKHNLKLIFVSNEMDTDNMKSTWPMPAPRIGDPMPPTFHLLALGVGIGGNANFSICVGVMQV